MTPLRAGLAGSCVTLSLLAAGTAGIALLYPSDDVAGPLARLFDPFAPVLLGLALLFGLLALLFGARWPGALLMLGAATAGGLLYYEHHALSLPALPTAEADLRVLFLNTYADNADDPAGIVAAALATEADVLIFAEAEPLRGQRQRLRATFDFVSDCADTECQLLIATDLKVLRHWQLPMNDIWPPRYAVLEIETGAGERLFLAVTHLAKPWLSGVAETELSRVTAQYQWLTGPVVIVGDFNMAPWSLPMRETLAQTGLRGVRLPPGTWPAAAGPVGLPIDQVLVRDGPRVVAVRAFGADLGSNHRGLVADIALE